MILKVKISGNLQEIKFAAETRQLFRPELELLNLQKGSWTVVGRFQSWLSASSRFKPDAEILLPGNRKTALNFINPLKGQHINIVSGIDPPFMYYVNGTELTNQLILTEAEQVDTPRDKMAGMNESMVEWKVMYESNV